MPDLYKYYPTLDIHQPIDYLEGVIDLATGQVPLVHKDEKLLEIVVVDAGLFKSFDPLSSYQAPYVEILIEGPEGRQLIETSTCHPLSEEPTYADEEEASYRPVWNERFMFKADGGVYVRFDVCIEHTVRNRTHCGHCAFTAEDLWSRALDGRQLLTVPLVHNKGGGWELEEELVGSLRLIVGLMTFDQVRHLPKFDKHPLKLDPNHDHHHGYKGEKKTKKKDTEEAIAEEVKMPTIEQITTYRPQWNTTVLSTVPPSRPSPNPVPTVTDGVFTVPMQSMTMMPSPVPMQATPSPVPMQSMLMSRPQQFSVPSPAPVPVQPAPNLVPTSLAPISYSTFSPPGGHLETFSQNNRETYEANAMAPQGIIGMLTGPDGN